MGPDDNQQDRKAVNQAYRPIQHPPRAPLSFALLVEVGVSKQVAKETKAPLPELGLSEDVRTAN